MPSRYPYQAVVRNQYLGVSKTIRAMSPEELDWLAQSQLVKWSEQEQRKREQKRKAAERETARREAGGLKEQAEESTQAARRSIEVFRNLLAGSLSRNPTIGWGQLLDRRPFSDFQFNYPKPDRDEIRWRLLGPAPQERTVSIPVPEEPGFLEVFLPFLRTWRLEREATAREAFRREKARAGAEFEAKLRAYREREREAMEAYNAALRKYNARLEQEKNQYAQARGAFQAKQEAHNKTVLAFRSRYEAGSAEAVERYVQMVMERSPYPGGVAGEPDIQFDDRGQTLVVNFCLPAPGDVPTLVEYKYVASRKVIQPVEMKPKDSELFYDDIIHQIALRTIREVLVADYARRVQAVVFNGWVHGIDSKTGKAFTSCILSCQAAREQFMQFDLARVAPKDCVRGLKGVTAGPLAMLAPVKPILEINRDDDRFVESREVLDRLRPDENLAAMDWEEFEHLIRELFEKEFMKSGGEVRITQASRDRGVDAIAFDPDPIRGGKVVIQAKRYNAVVPVSAVRDLYGTVMSEGANKGILVTTSYFGPDSREFAKDKPITLLDGENLLHLFQQHGYNLHIALLPKGDPRRGLGVNAAT